MPTLRRSKNCCAMGAATMRRDVAVQIWPVVQKMENCAPR